MSETYGTCERCQRPTTTLRCDTEGCGNAMSTAGGGAGWWEIVVRDCDPSHIPPGEEEYQRSSDNPGYTTRKHACCWAHATKMAERLEGDLIRMYLYRARP